MLTASDGAAFDNLGWSAALSGSTAADGAQGDDFGASVALSTSTAVVGAPGKNQATGAAYVFVNV